MTVFYKISPGAAIFKLVLEQWVLLKIFYEFYNMTSGDHLYVFSIEWLDYVPGTGDRRRKEEALLSGLQARRAWRPEGPQGRKILKSLLVWLKITLNCVNDLANKPISALASGNIVQIILNYLILLLTKESFRFLFLQYAVTNLALRVLENIVCSSS